MKQIILQVLFTAFLFAIAARVQAQTVPTSAGEVRVLMTQPLSDRREIDVTVLSVDYPPGGSTPPHEHPGHTYAYVLEGAVVSQLDDQPPQTFTTPGPHRSIGTRSALATLLARNAWSISRSKKSSRTKRDSP